MYSEKNNEGIFVEHAVRTPTFRMNYEHLHSYVEFFWLKTGYCTYYVNGKEFQYEEGEQPAGAVEVKPEKKSAEPQNKAVKPANKAKAVKGK